MISPNPKLQLQVGGTLNPRRHLYIERPEDAELLMRLRGGEYCNVLASRQMGKSSLMARTALTLSEQNVLLVRIDIAGELGSTAEPETWYLGLLEKIAYDLKLGLDAADWWRATVGTPNQKLLRFLRREVAERIDAPIVIFLDEIDSTLRLPFTDDLFTALRTACNERPFVSAYERITFCLLGVATPNELIKDPRTTAYNVGSTLELRDFEESRDDLSLLAAALHGDLEVGRHVLNRVLHWTGGHPYLTVKLCDALHRRSVRDAEGVDAYVAETFGRLERLSADVHFQQILRFLETRVSDALGTLRLYERIIQGRKEHSRASLMHAQLQLSGLVKRDSEGCLVVRNPLYARLFDNRWLDTFKPKRDLGPYQIQTTVKQKQSGTVYLAHHRDLDRRVAIKQTRLGAGSTLGLERLWRVTRAMTSLSHPAIVRVYDLVEVRDGAYIVMEWVEGRTLRAILDNGPLAPARAIRLAMEIADGLQAAHSAGIVHRDLGPDNVMITVDDRAKILGFGQAKPIQESLDEVQTVTADLALFNVTSPEQATGSTVDHRADLFALGLLLYEMVTGQHPFARPQANLFQQIHALLNEQQKPAADIGSEVPLRLSALIDRLLIKDPERRLSPAVKVVAALRRLEGSVSFPEPEVCPLEPEVGAGRYNRQRVDEVIAEALALVPKDRSEFLELVCGDDIELRQEVESVLEVDKAAEPTGQPLGASSFQDLNKAVDDRVGPYRILRELGRGGMGSVFLAQRRDVLDRQVAVKVIARRSLSEEALFRFSNEQQILAHLSHPNIPKFLDGGTTDDGLPYFAMDHVAGEWIDVYCDRHKLSLEARLALFGEVCLAVGFAHQKSIVHADLKPSNVLVDALGQPKLLDFGIARVLNAENTLAERGTSRPMTVKYASPEEVRGMPITYAADIYALGAILYKLLSGVDYFQTDSRASVLEIFRAIVEKSPKRPSHVVGDKDPRLARRLAGDLDLIVLKALRKEPQQRYGSAEEFAEDLRRYSECRPVSAHRPTPVYRAGKFLRRHRVAFAVTILFLVLAALSASL